MSGWWKCAPLIVLPFGILFSEAWFQTNILRNNYRIHELTLDKRALETEINVLSDGRNRLSRMERIDARASRLGLVKPRPGQTRIVGETVTLALANPSPNEVGIAGESTRLAKLEPFGGKRNLVELDVVSPPMEGLSGTD